MPKHLWSLLCRRGIVDKYTNLLTIVDVLDELSLKIFPQMGEEEVAMTLDGTLVSVWARSDPRTPEDFWQTIIVVGPGDEDLGEVKIHGNLTDHQRTRLLFSVQAVRYSGTGVYRFDLYHSRTKAARGRLANSVHLEIKKPKDISSTSQEQPFEQS